MPRESDNLPTGGTDNASSISLDDAANLDWVDPGEDTDPTDDEQQSNDETVETDDETDGQETDAATDGAESEDDGEGEGDDQPDPAPVKDDVTITLQTGETVPLGELKSGYLRQADYSRKTQELGNRRRDVETLATNVQAAVAAIAGHLQKTLPQAPDPNLAITDPNKYTRMKALHDQSMAQLAQVVQAAQAPKAALNTLTEQQHREHVASETAKLAEAFPQVRTPEGHKAFFDSAAKTAKELGYSDDEVASATDHRLFKLAHYARIGMQAEAARAKAKDKVKDAPPVAQQKRQQGASAAAAKRNSDAMRRLSQSGSIDDAMKVDFT